MSAEQEQKLEPNLSKKDKTVIEILNGARRGQFVEVELLDESFEKAKSKIENSRFIREVGDNLLRRTSSIRQDGKDAIGHLALSYISFSTLRRLGRDVLKNPNTATISGLRRILNGEELVFKPGVPRNMPWKSILDEASKALEEFDKLGKRKKFNPPGGFQRK